MVGAPVVWNGGPEVEERCKSAQRGSAKIPGGGPFTLSGSLWVRRHKVQRYDVWGLSSVRTDESTEGKGSGDDSGGGRCEYKVDRRSAPTAYTILQRGLDAKGTECGLPND